MKKYTTQGRNCGGLVKGYADGGVVEGIVDTMTGRSRSGRALYNATRGDTVGETIMGKQASEGNLRRKMTRNASDARDISESVPRRGGDK